jgi:hypothetical protein
MYERQHGLTANLFLAPGEGDVVPAEPPGPEEAPAVEKRPRMLGLIDP